MATTKVIPIALDVSQLDDAGLVALVTGILQAAPQGAVYAASPAVQASVAVLGTANATFKTTTDAVAADTTKLANDKQAYTDARSTLVTNVVQLKGLVGTTAKTAADVTGAGFALLDRALPGVLMIPSGVDIFYPKNGHGRAKATVQQTGSSKRYDAQVCLDPMAQNTWADLAGDGRSHWLTTYKSATVVWVRYRAVRGHEKSDWCAPVAVTIP